MLAIVAFATIGCGGSGESTVTVTESEVAGDGSAVGDVELDDFRSEAARICATVADALNGLRNANSLPDVAAEAADAHPAIEAGGEGLKDLRPPEEIASAYYEFLSALEEQEILVWGLSRMRSRDDWASGGVVQIDLLRKAVKEGRRAALKANLDGPCAEMRA